MNRRQRPEKHNDASRSAVQSDALVLAEHPRAIVYPPGSWGPTEANHLIAPDGGWHNPVTANLR